MSETLTADPGLAGRFEDRPEIGCIETDRFCDGCGYNLRTQTVRRDPHTNLLLVRCPECRQFAPANDGASAGRLWLHRLATLLLFLWIIVVGAAATGYVTALGGVSIGTLEELAGRRTITWVTTSTAGGTATTRTYRSVHAPDFEHYYEFLAAVGLASLALAFVGMALLTVLFPHWPKWVYRLVAVALPLLVAPVITVGFWMDRPTHLLWSVPFITGHALLQILGGLLAAGTGRGLARALVRAVLPPRLRPALAYLWLADNQVPPLDTSRNQPADTF